MTLSSISNSSSSSSSRGPDPEDEFTTHIISGVHFASLLSLPRKSTVIPSAQWSTANHHLFPDSFQRATKTLLLCRNSKIIQPIVQEKPRDRTNLSASLPKEVWLHILSFTTRKWFEPKQSELELLRRENEVMRLRLSQEQSTLSQTRQALSSTESRHHLLQRQHQIQLSIARQLYHQIENILHHGPIDGATGELPLSPMILSSTQSLLDQTRNALFNTEISRMDVSFEMMEEDEDSDSDEDDSSVDRDDDRDDEAMSFDSETHLSMEESDSAVAGEQQPSAENARQVRTVSISSVDL